MTKGKKQDSMVIRNDTNIKLKIDYHIGSCFANPLISGVQSISRSITPKDIHRHFSKETKYYK